MDKKRRIEAKWYGYAVEAGACHSMMAGKYNLLA
jgi:hypothetical protein